ncbi:MAG TPA: maleylpyruvate isomerase family mycothiol-dependent enzyme [Streptosporangiaceae bacterium]|nr:maleylpyruvate isomerase family mycothiol-dependent enzyme [Streptosporangiaceae bacterium]
MMDLIVAERRALVGVLEDLSADQWHAPSLCEGWTVAHVVAHLTMPFRISPEEFGQGMAQAHGDFTVFSDAVAARDSELPQADLVAALRDNVANPWQPPGGGLVGALSHDIIHGLDTARPLGITYPVPDQAMTAVLDMAVSPGGESLFGFDLRGIELRASDLGWSSGTGDPVIGHSRDVLLLTAGRIVPPEAFTGPGVQRVWAGAR